MRFTRMVYLGLFLLLVVMAAAPALAADASGLAARAATWEKEYNADNLQGVADMYSADACRMPPNQKEACGTAAIVAQLKAGKDQGLAKVKIAVTVAETIGDWGYGAGTYELTGADGSHKDHGKWMNVSKKINGTWKIQRDMFNSDMPLPSATK